MKAIMASLVLLLSVSAAQADSPKKCEQAVADYMSAQGVDDVTWSRGYADYVGGDNDHLVGFTYWHRLGRCGDEGYYVVKTTSGCAIKRAYTHGNCEL